MCIYILQKSLLRYFDPFPTCTDVEMEQLYTLQSPRCQHKQHNIATDSDILKHNEFQRCFVFETLVYAVSDHSYEIDTCSVPMMYYATITMLQN